MFLFDIHVSTIEALKIKETNKPLFKLQILSITSCSIHYEFLLEEYQGREHFLNHLFVKVAERGYLCLH